MRALCYRVDLLLVLITLRVWRTSAAGVWGCLAWRQTSGCDATGSQRDPSGDMPCHLTIQSGRSGFCSCAEFGAEGHDSEKKFATHHVGCVHEPFQCREACLDIIPTHAPTHAPTELLIPMCGKGGEWDAVEGKLEISHLLRSKWNANPAAHVAAVVAALSDAINLVVPDRCAVLPSAISTSSASSLVITDGKEGGVLIFYKITLADLQTALAAALASQLAAMLSAGLLNKELLRELTQRAQRGDDGAPPPTVEGTATAVLATAALPGAPDAGAAPGDGEEGGAEIGTGGEHLSPSEDFEIAFGATSLGVIAPILLCVLSGVAVGAWVWRTHRRRQLERWARRDETVGAVDDDDGSLPMSLPLRRWGASTSFGVSMGLIHDSDAYEGGVSEQLTGESEEAMGSVVKEEEKAAERERDGEDEDERGGSTVQASSVLGVGANFDEAAFGRAFGSSLSSSEEEEGRQIIWFG